MEWSEHFIEPSTVALAVDGPPLLLLGDLEDMLVSCLYSSCAFSVERVLIHMLVSRLCRSCAFSVERVLIH